MTSGRLKPGDERLALELLEEALEHDPADPAGYAAAAGEFDRPVRERALELLGRGGMGTVYKARRDETDFEHLVAIKVIK